MRCLEDVDPDVIRQYQELEAEIEALSRDVEEFENRTEQKKGESIVVARGFCFKLAS